MRTLWIIATATCFSSAAFAASSIRYSLGNIGVDYEWYTDTQKGSVAMKMHALELNDESGELSASLSNMGNRAAAEAGAINAERDKVRRGESAGGTKILSYSWQQVAAEAGDAKRYGLRLGSNDNIFSFEPMFGSTSDHYQSYAELSLLAYVWGDVLMATESYILRHDVGFGARWGSFRDVDKRYPSTRQNDDKNIDSGYFYMPLSYRLGLFLPANIRFFAEYGQDPLTIARRFGMGEDALPLDSFLALSAEYRTMDVVSIGAQMEQYTGSMIQSGRWKIRNPDYKHQILMIYVTFGGS